MDSNAKREPGLAHARLTAQVAHSIVIKMQEMGLPEDLFGDLSSLCTDLADLWGAEKVFAKRLENLLESENGWGSVGDHLVDLQTTIEHIRKHANGVAESIENIVRFAYEHSDESINAT